MDFDDRLRQLAPDAQVYIPRPIFQRAANALLRRLPGKLQVSLSRHYGFHHLRDALAATTHLLFVAHADDDGLIGAQAIAETYRKQNKHMLVVVVSASPGTGRPPGYEETKYTDKRMIQIRLAEQFAAAKRGKYAATIQLGFESADIKAIEDPENGDPERAGNVAATLKTILDHCPNLEKLYLHNVFDFHDTHHALVMLSLEAVRRMEPDKRPKECIGVEVSSHSAWVPAEHRILLPVLRMRLVKAVLRKYKTELAKRRYDKGLEGRAIANEVFKRDTKVTSTNTPHICGVSYQSVIDSSYNLGISMILFKHKILASFQAEKMRMDKSRRYIGWRPEKKQLESLKI